MLLLFYANICTEIPPAIKLKIGFMGICSSRHPPRTVARTMSALSLLELVAAAAAAAVMTTQRLVFCWCIPCFSVGPRRPAGPVGAPADVPWRPQNPYWVLRIYFYWQKGYISKRASYWSCNNIRFQAVPEETTMNIAASMAALVSEGPHAPHPWALAKHEFVCAASIVEKPDMWSPWRRGV